MYVPTQEEAREIAGDLTEKPGSPTHDLGHDASSKSRVVLGIAYRGEEAVSGLEASHIGLSKSRFSRVG